MLRTVRIVSGLGRLAISRVSLENQLNSIHTTCLLAAFKKGRGTGDQGKSSLFNNERRWKDDLTFQALGAVDELNSYIGICRESVHQKGLFDVENVLLRVQCCLQDVGSHVATPPDSSSKTKKEMSKFDVSLFDFVNSQIDVYGDRVPPSNMFILPGGGITAAHLQYARAVCRSAERSLVPLLRDGMIDKNCLRFLNRLSDLLFVLGRYSCMQTGEREVIYQRPQFFDPEMKYEVKKIGETK